MPGAFKLDHFHLGEQIFLINFPTYNLHTGEPNSYCRYCPRERLNLKMRKGNSRKMDVTQWFWYLGHSNWTICSLLSQFCSKQFTILKLLYWGSHFLLPQRAENEEKVLAQKKDETQWFQWLEHSNRSICI